MGAFEILNLQFTCSLVVFALIARWHVAPRLAGRPLPAALVPLLWVHVFRYTPMTLLVPGQTSADIPPWVAAAIAFGDLVAAAFAFAAVILCRRGARLAVPMALTFNVIGVVDIINALRVGVGAELFGYALGFNWYILNFYVPALIVTHVMMLARIVRRAPAAQ